MELEAVMVLPPLKLELETIVDMVDDAVKVAVDPIIVEDEPIPITPGARFSGAIAARAAKDA